MGIGTNSNIYIFKRFLSFFLVALRFLDPKVALTIIYCCVMLSKFEKPLNLK